MWRREAIRPLEFVALLPVFNGERHLLACLDSLAGAVDGIIALDDGSDDATPEILRAHPAVKEIITYDPKPLAQWDEPWTRYVLYRAAAGYSPTWVLCFDADEELDPMFGLFRQELLSQPANICGYVFPRVAVHGSKVTRPIFIHRMYRYAAEYTFHQKRLHCRSIPLEIDLEELRIVNVRILHHSGSPEDKQARYARYEIADPNRRYQSSYENLLQIHPSLDPLPMGSTLRLLPVHEDGFQQPLVAERYFDRVDEAEIHAPSVELQARLSALLPRIASFMRLRMRAYRLQRHSKGFVARYSYGDTEADVLLREAFIIESYWTSKDYFDIVARFAAQFGLSVREAVSEVDAGLGELQRLGILHVRDS